jgi:hypothetical protein
MADTGGGSGDEVRLVDVSLSVIWLSCLNRCGQVMRLLLRGCAGQLDNRAIFACSGE